MKQVFRSIATWMREDGLRDATGVVGGSLIAFGAWRIYAPAGYIVAGILLLTLAIVLGIVAVRSEPPEDVG